MKGSERARALCDKKHLAEKLNKIEDVFVANGYPRETVKILPQRDREKIYGRKTSTSDRQKRTGRTGKSWNRDHPYLKGLSEQFRRTANRHSFRGALKLEEILKRLNVHVKSRMVKGRNMLCIRFLVPARILCM